MSFIEKHLMADEHVAYMAKLHWIIFIVPAACFVAALLLFILISDYPVLGWIGLLIAIVSVIPVVFKFVSSEFAVSNKRVLVKDGFIRRNSVEILLKKVEGIHVQQGLLGRLLDFGTIIIIGTGGTKDPFDNISAPLQLRKIVQEQIEGHSV